MAGGCPPPPGMPIIAPVGRLATAEPSGAGYSHPQTSPRGLAPVLRIFTPDGTAAVAPRSTGAAAPYRSKRRPRPWLSLLARLVRSGLSDKQAAQRMTEHGDFGTWTRRQVEWHRVHTLQLPANRTSRRSLPFPSLAEARSISSRVAAAHRGWGHLFTPCPEGSRPHVERLSRSECDVLDSLENFGPGGGAHVSSYALRRLLKNGLVVRTTFVSSLTRTVTPGYALAKGVRRKTPNARPTSIDLLLNRLMDARAA